MICDGLLHFISSLFTLLKRTGACCNALNECVINSVFVFAHNDLTTIIFANMNECLLLYAYSMVLF